MNIQFVNIVDGRVRTYTSPDFPHLSEDKLKPFVDWCGSEDADPDGKTFWSYDREDDTLVIDFAHWPSNPQRIVTLFAGRLGVSLAPFATWTEGSEP
jgi:hypothetical protein